MISWCCYNCGNTIINNRQQHVSIASSSKGEGEREREIGRCCSTYNIYHTQTHMHIIYDIMLQRAPASSTTMCGMMRVRYATQLSVARPSVAPLPLVPFIRHAGLRLCIFITKRVNFHENENDFPFHSARNFIKTLLKCSLWHGWGSDLEDQGASCSGVLRFIIYSKLSKCFAYHKKDFYAFPV